MSHMIDEKIDTVYTPTGEFSKTWHGLETVVSGKILPDGSNVPDVFCPVIECKMKPDFQGEIATTEENELTAQMKDWKLIMADCRKGKSGKVIPLHIPKKGYAIHQNKLLFDAMVSAAQKVLGNGFEIATVGTLGAYSQFFISILIKGNSEFCVGKNDTHKQFFNLNSSHDGLISSHVLLSIVRMVCFNTVQFAISDAEQSGNISVLKHTKNSVELVTPERFETDLRDWVTKSAEFQKTLAALKTQKMTLDSFRSFVSGVFTNAASDQLSTNSFNRIGEMEVLFSRGLGNSGNTRYDALNAFTEYFTHGNGAGNPENVTKAKRIATANFGKGNDWKLQAIRSLSTETDFKATVKRGEILYEDKVMVESSKN